MKVILTIKYKKTWEKLVILLMSKSGYARNYLFSNNKWQLEKLKKI